MFIVFQPNYILSGENMNLKYVAAALVLVVIVGVGFFALTGTKNAPTNQSSGNQMQAAASGVSSSPSSKSVALFNNSQYAQYGYLISSPVLSQQAKAALAGFNLSRTQLSNGTVVIGLTLAGSGQTQNVDVASGDKLYFIETTFGDDGFGFDSSLGDDGVILVNQTGAIV
jgi:hypothetical protein